jgi:gas vesicle protein
MIAVLGSAAAGLFAGMLLAPRKGSETRENVMDFIRRHCRELKTVHPPKV